MLFADSHTGWLDRSANHVSKSHPSTTMSRRACRLIDCHVCSPHLFNDSAVAAEDAGRYTAQIGVLMRNAMRRNRTDSCQQSAVPAATTSDRNFSYGGLSMAASSRVLLCEVDQRQKCSREALMYPAVLQLLGGVLVGVDC